MDDATPVIPHEAPILESEEWKAFMTSLVRCMEYIKHIPQHPAIELEFRAGSCIYTRPHHITGDHLLPLLKEHIVDESIIPRDARYQSFKPGLSKQHFDSIDTTLSKCSRKQVWSTITDWTMSQDTVYKSPNPSRVHEQTRSTLGGGNDLRQVGFEDYDPWVIKKTCLMDVVLGSNVLYQHDIKINLSTEMPIDTHVQDMRRMDTALNNTLLNPRLQQWVRVKCRKSYYHASGLWRIDLTKVWQNRDFELAYQDTMDEQVEPTYEVEFEIVSLKSYMQLDRRSQLNNLLSSTLKFFMNLITINKPWEEIVHPLLTPEELPDASYRIHGNHCYLSNAHSSSSQ